MVARLIVVMANDQLFFLSHFSWVVTELVHVFWLNDGLKNLCDSEFLVREHKGVHIL